MPTLLQDIGLDQKLNEPLPLTLKFNDEQGREVALGDYFGRRPVILVLAYYECPMLCTQVLNGLVSAIGVLNFSVGKEFDIVTVSFDPGETPELARGKKAAYIERYKRAGAEAGWHFLTGSQHSITQLTRAVGFRYAYNAEVDQYAHPSGIIVATPDGRLSRYFYGIEYGPRDLRLALIEAADRQDRQPGGPAAPGLFPLRPEERQVQPGDHAAGADGRHSHGRGHRPDDSDVAAPGPTGPAVARRRAPDAPRRDESDL